MQVNDFNRKCTEFAFLLEIFAQERITAEMKDFDGNEKLRGIEVRRGDKNLLEVVPRIFVKEIGMRDEYCYSREFWVVLVNGAMRKTESAFEQQFRFKFPSRQSAPVIGEQLAERNEEVGFLVEISRNCDDGYNNLIEVVVYKMQGFNWRKYAVFGKQ